MVSTQQIQTLLEYLWLNSSLICIGPCLVIGHNHPDIWLGKDNHCTVLLQMNSPPLDENPSNKHSFPFKINSILDVFCWFQISKIFYQAILIIITNHLVTF